MRSNLALFVAIIVLVGIGAVWIRLLNRKHSGTRERLGKSANAVDFSMENKKSFGPHEDGSTAEVIGDKGLDDVTDLKNEDFIYVY